MGVALWLTCGVVAALLARIIPLGRPPGRIVEIAVAIVTAVLLGLTATALDFGGWAEVEWRAGLFVFLGALALVGAVRVVRN